MLATSFLCVSCDLEVRKNLECRRLEFDRYRHDVQKNKSILTSLKLELRDLKCDGAAIGLGNFPETKARLKPIASISRRPIFTPDGDIENMVNMVGVKLEQADAVKHTTSQYINMTKRLETERVAEIYKQSRIQDDSREIKLHTLELKRAVTQATEALDKEHRELKHFTQKYKQEAALWAMEMSGRKKCKKEKDKFEKFCNHNTDRQREIELEASGDLGSEQEKELRATRAMMEITKVKKRNEAATTMIEAENEEGIYKEAFLNIGARASAFNPNAIIKSCLVQDDVKKDLEAKRCKFEKAILILTAKLGDLKNEHQDKEFSMSPTKSLSKSFAEKEKILSQKTKAYEYERKQFDFINKDMHPVQQGLKLILKKVLGVNVDTTDVHEIKRHIDAVEARLLEIMKSNAQIEKSLNSFEKKKLHSLAATSSLTSNNNSANNVRVLSTIDKVDPVFLERRKDTKSGDSLSLDGPKQRNRTKSRGISVGHVDDDDSILPDRMSLKIDSSTVLTAQMEKDSRRNSPKKGASQRGGVNRLAVGKGKNKKRMVVNRF